MFIRTQALYYCKCISIVSIEYSQAEVKACHFSLFWPEITEEELPHC